MFRLAVRMLRFRKGGFAASFIALFFGAAIVLACGGLMETGIRTALPPDRFATAAVVVGGDQEFQLAGEPTAVGEEPDERDSGVLTERVRIDAGLVDRIRAVPGVANAYGDVTFATGPVEGGPQTPGHGWSSAEPAGERLVAGAAPASGQVVVPSTSGKQPGDALTLAIRGKVENFRVSGILDGPSPMFFEDREAGRLLGKPGAVDAIGVLAEPGADVAALQTRVDALLDGQRARTFVGEDRGLAEFPEAAEGGVNLITLAGVFGGLAITVAVFVVASTLSLSVRQRAREMALLRAVGTTPGQLRRMIFGETLVVATVAGTLAYFPGGWLGRFLFEQLAERGLASPRIVFHQGWIPLVVAAGATLLAAVGAAFAAGGRAARARPTEALAESAVPRRWLTVPRLLLALLTLGGGTALVIVTSTVMTGPVAASTAGPTVMLWATALALLAPGVARLATAVLGAPLRAFTGISGRLAVLNAKKHQVRMAAAITPIMLASGLALSMIYLQTTQADAAEREFTGNLRADAVLTSAAGGFGPALAGEVAKLPGVAGASALVTSGGYVETPYDGGWQGDEPLPLRGVTAEGAEQTMATQFAAGSPADLRGNAVALPVELAASLGRGVGDTVTMRFGDGERAEMRIAGLVAGQPGYEMGLVAAELLTGHTSTGTVPTILVRASSGVDYDQLAATLATLEQPGLRISDRAMATAQNAEQGNIGEWINYLLVGMIVGYTVISLVNTLVLATLERRREFALQRLVGATRGQVLRMAAVEATLITVAGVVLGGLVSLSSLVPFSLVVSDTPVPSGPISVLLVVIGLAAGLAYASTLITTWFVLRARPVEAAVVA